MSKRSRRGYPADRRDGRKGRGISPIIYVLIAVVVIAAIILIFVR